MMDGLGLRACFLVSAKPECEASSSSYSTLLSSSVMFVMFSLFVIDSSNGGKQSTPYLLSASIVSNNSMEGIIAMRPCHFIFYDFSKKMYSKMKRKPSSSPNNCCERQWQIKMGSHYTNCSNCGKIEPWKWWSVLWRLSWCLASLGRELGILEYVNIFLIV